MLGVIEEFKRKAKITIHNEAHRRLRPILLRIGNTEEKKTPRQRTNNILIPYDFGAQAHFSTNQQLLFLKLI